MDEPLAESSIGNSYEAPRTRRRPGGNLKKLGQGGSVYFFGYEIWQKLTFLGKKKWIYFLGSDFFNIIFWGSDKVIKLMFLC